MLVVLLTCLRDAGNIGGHLIGTRHRGGRSDAPGINCPSASRRDPLASCFSRSSLIGMPSSIVVVMGVSGCGKSTIGKGLADALHVPFIDADDLHPKANVDKMAQGEPLTDADRLPWLRIVRDAAVRTCRVEHAAGHETGVVIACSALRRSYRDLLRGISEGEVGHADAGDGETLRTFFCLVDGPRELLFERMSARKNHFMKAKMLDSQIATLENPRGENGVFVVRLEDSPEDQVRSAVEELAKHGVRPAETEHPTREAVGEGVPVVIDSDNSIQKGSQEVEATA